MSKKVLVTGASGFVGKYLVEALLTKKYEVFASVYAQADDLKNLIGQDHVFQGDLTNSTFALELIESIKPAITFNLAALSVVHNSVERAASVLSSNLILQYNLLEAIRLHAPNSRFVAICSANEYGLVNEKDVPIDENAPFKPLNPYAVSKLSQDMLALQYYLSYDLDIVRLRPFNHTGVGQTTDFVIPSLVKQFVNIASGKTEPNLEVGNLESIRDFTDVRDMVDAYILAGEKCEKGEVYNIGFGKGIMVKEIISLLEEISGTKVVIRTNEDRVRRSDVPVLIANADKFKALTGWAPKIKFKDTLNWIYNNYKENSHV